jgi:hypothetical protein
MSADDDDVLLAVAEKKGFLQKEGDKFKTWKKRW